MNPLFTGNPVFPVGNKLLGNQKFSMRQTPHEFKSHVIFSWFQSGKSETSVRVSAENAGGLISTSSSPVYFSFGTSRDTPAIPHKLIAKLHQLNAWKRLQRSLNCKYTLPNLIGYLRAKIQKTNQAGSVCHPTFPKLIEGGHKKNVSNNIKLICAVTVVVTVVTAVAVVLFLFSPQKQ